MFAIKSIFFNRTHFHPGYQWCKVYHCDRKTTPIGPAVYENPLVIGLVAGGIGLFLFSVILGCLMWRYRSQLRSLRSKKLTKITNSLIIYWHLERLLFVHNIVEKKDCRVVKILFFFNIFYNTFCYIKRILLNLY